MSGHLLGCGSSTLPLRFCLLKSAWVTVEGRPVLPLLKHVDLGKVRSGDPLELQAQLPEPLLVRLGESKLGIIPFLVRLAPSSASATAQPYLC